MSHLKPEKLKYTARDNTQKYYKVWQPFLYYYENEFPSLHSSIFLIIFILLNTIIMPFSSFYR